MYQRLTSHRAFNEQNVTRRRSGLLLPAGSAVPNERPTAIDLFSGCGGFSLGFLSAAFEVVLALDNNVSALATYWYNLCGPGSRWVGTPDSARKRDKATGGTFNDAAPDHPPVQVVVCDDVRRWTGQKLLDLVGMGVGDIDVVMGGPPCQGFSQANIGRSVHDPRNSLVWEFARLVHEIKPKTFVMENVPEMTTMITPSGIPLVEALIRAFEDESYLAVSQKFGDAVKAARITNGIVGMQKLPEVELNREPVQLGLFEGW